MAREAFFLPAENGYRFCLYTPAPGNNEKAALIYLHPFAEELNKTRRMVALQVKAVFCRLTFSAAVTAAEISVMRLGLPGLPILNSPINASASVRQRQSGFGACAQAA